MGALDETGQAKQGTATAGVKRLNSLQKAAREAGSLLAFEPAW